MFYSGIRVCASRPDIMAAAIVNQIGRAYHMGFSIRRIANELGLSRYHVNWAIDEFARRARAKKETALTQAAARA
jgi:transposase-like protein